MFTHILEKLKKNNKDFEKWSKDERKALLDLYLIISENEDSILDFVYTYHSCDTWEDIFRDYNRCLLKDKEDGIKISLKNFEEYEKYKKK